MSHISSIGAAVFTDLSVAIGTVTSGVAAAALPATKDKAGFDALFVTATSNPKYLRVPNVREFPAIGAQPNLVNVPVYGQKQSQTVGGQSDAPQMEVTINYVGSQWAKGTTATAWTSGEPTTFGSEMANMVGDGVARAWRFTLLAAQPTGATIGASQSQWDSNTGGIGKVENSMFYFIGKLESMLVTPSLTDATTATLAFSIQSDIYGAFTV
jgi:hypothetical protein